MRGIVFLLVAGSAFAASPAQRAERLSDFQGLILLGVFVLILVFIVRMAKPNKLSESERNRMTAEGEAFIEQLKSGQIAKLDVSMVLLKGEVALKVENSSLYESRSTRVYMGGGTRVGRIYVGGGQSNSVQSLKKVDSGILVMTNKRLFFNGQLETRVSSYKDIASVEPYSDAIEVGFSKKAKNQVYSVANPILWTAVLKNFASGNMEVSE